MLEFNHVSAEFTLCALPPWLLPKKKREILKIKLPYLAKLSMLISLKITIYMNTLFLFIVIQGKIFTQIRKPNHAVIGNILNYHIGSST